MSDQCAGHRFMPWRGDAVRCSSPSAIARACGLIEYGGVSGDGGQNRQARATVCAHAVEHGTPRPRVAAVAPSRAISFGNSADWMLEGRQEERGRGGRIDLLAVAPDGALVLIELKRGRKPEQSPFAAYCRASPEPPKGAVQAGSGAG